MLQSAVPAKVTLPFGANALANDIRPVPNPSQISSDPNAASFNDGFPPNTFAAGGWPDGRDVNGLFNQITAWELWKAMGGPVYFDATFATAIGGYAKGSFVGATAVPNAFWLSTSDNNSVNPDAAWTSAPGTQPAGWLLCQIDEQSLDSRYNLGGPIRGNCERLDGDGL